MSDKQEALQEIVTIVNNHNLTFQEVAAALTDKHEITLQKRSGALLRIFGYIGSILVFAGISILIGMQWDNLGSSGRVFVTLGVGFFFFLIALFAIDHPRFDRIATPLLLIAALFQPVGILVMLDEYSRGGDPLHGAFFMSTLMFIQQGLVFWQKKRTTLAFTTIFFACILFLTAFELLEMTGNLTWLTIGTSLMFISWALSHSRHQAISAFWYFIGSITLLYAAFDMVQDKPYEVAYIGLTALIIYISTTARSRTLLLVGTFSMLGYISYFTYEYFRNTLGWPIVLIICGIIFIVIGLITAKINARYIRTQS